MLADFTKRILNFSFVIEKKYKQKFFSTQIVDISKDTMGSEFLSKINAQYYYRYTRVAMMILKHEDTLALVGSLSGHYAGSRRLESPIEMMSGYKQWPQSSL